jgi:alpha-tubulin suppressor-like RCC1 family protein
MFGIILDESGSLWSWGSNSSGELALGDINPRSYPTEISNSKNFGIKDFSCGSYHVVAIGNSFQPKNFNKGVKN